MNTAFLTPVEEHAIAHLVLHSPSCIGRKIQIHTQREGFPDLDNVKIAIFGVQEDRNSENNFGCGDNLHFIRRKFYELFPGDWHTEIADLGNVLKGNEVNDTYFAVAEIINYLLKKNIIPVILGGGQDITYVNYRAYDTLEQTVNITAVDSRFDLGSFEEGLTSQSYLSKIIMQEPNNLFNYTNVGYQTYFNPQDEIDLLESLYFDTFRLGKAKELENIEPAFRDADIVSIDIGAVKQSDAPANNNASPNGFYGDEICAIASEFQIPIIEDAAEGLGSHINGKYLGTFGDIGCISFHDTKNIQCGEGGAILINNKTLIEKIDVIIEKGTDRKAFLAGEVNEYTWKTLGSSYGLSEINAAFLLAQLQALKKVTKKRKSLYSLSLNRY